MIFHFWTSTFGKILDFRIQVSDLKLDLENWNFNIDISLLDFDFRCRKFLKS